MNQEEKNELFQKHADKIATILANKNEDYGDSFYDVFKEFGDLSVLIRLTDKMGRMESLVKGLEPLVENEPLEDVYRDMAGYCILALVSIERLKNQTNQRSE